LPERREYSIRRLIGQEPLPYNLQAVVKFDVIHSFSDTGLGTPWAIMTLAIIGLEIVGWFGDSIWRTLADRNE
jgi:hypothetical protein